MMRSDSCDGPKCSDVAHKLSQIFGWRQTYNVEKLQKNIRDHDISRISIIRSNRAEGSNSRSKEGTESWVAVNNLKSQGGGILDPDDRLSDVVDDREQIYVSFESDDGIHHHVGGDGASGSSDGTGSPELFKNVDHKYAYRKMHRSSMKSRTDIEVTGTNLACGSHIIPTLQVRRGSEPDLTQKSQTANMKLNRNNPISDHTKRWSAAPLILDCQSSQQPWQQDPSTNSIEKKTDVRKQTTENFWRLSRDSMLEQDDDSASNGFFHLPRNNTNRLSMQFTIDSKGNNMPKIGERTYNAKTKVTSRSLPRDQKRKEPLGQANSTASSPTPGLELDVDRSELIVVRNDTGPLGIHVIPDYDHHGKDRGLLIQGIDPDGRVYQDGRLALYDRIIEINGQSVLNLPFQRVQEMFKLSLISPELSLRFIRDEDAKTGKPPPPVYPRLSDNKENIGKLDRFKTYDTTNLKVATVSPTKKLTTTSRTQKSLLTVNTRKIGRKIELELVKAPPPHGLGFSITTRDNPAGGNCPIYIKNIIPKGAAIQDGRLKIGDRLLEVNDVEMTGKSQSEAVSVLRNVSAGSKVRIVVSRQEDITNSDIPQAINFDSALNRSSLPHHNDYSDKCSSFYSTGDKINVGIRSNLISSSPLHPVHDLLQQQLKLSGSTRSDKVGQSARVPSDTYSQALEIYGEASSFSWKHKEILTLDIPVHDSEKAGLGISVKGKTSGNQDLGIFIKSVINGGAASRDRRLCTNDQLLNVNNISLLYQSNSDAMETLRKAMLHTEGPVPGSITLTIARRSPVQTPISAFESSSIQNAFLHRSFNDYLSGSNHSDVLKSNKILNRSLDSSSIHDSTKQLKYNLITNGSDDDCSTLSALRYNGMDGFQYPNYTTEHTVEKDCASTKTVTVIPHERQIDGAMNTWNPVLDKLTGESNKQLRNDSYYKATNENHASTYMISREIRRNNVIKTPFGETFLIEDEYGSQLPNQIPTGNLRDQASKNLHMNHFHLNTLHKSLYTGHNLSQNKEQLTNSIATSNDVMPLNSLYSTTTTNDMKDGNAVATTINKPLPHHRPCLQTEMVYVSQFALKDPPAGFTRDAFGRQSMSEKRHAALDAKCTDTYQRSKKMREKRGKNKYETDDQMLAELGPFLGMKKSSSLESLQTMVQEIKKKDGDPKNKYIGKFGTIFCDDGTKTNFQVTSKRDDFDVVSESPNMLGPDHQTKTSAKKHWLLDPPIDINNDNAEFTSERGVLRQSSLSTCGKSKRGKKKSGLLKGIGTIFR